MLRTFPIDFIRQIIEQTLLEEKNKPSNASLELIGGKDQVCIHSFYEHLATDSEVNRFVETFRDLTDQQNRMGLIANGVIVAPENPTITNINSALIIPMSFTCSVRCTLKDRDIVLMSFNNMIDKLKGRKQDIAEFDDGKVFKVGTMGNNVNGNPTISSGDFLGAFDHDDDYDTQIKALFTEFGSLVIDGDYFYIQDISDDYGTIKVVVYNGTTQKFVIVEDDGTYPNVIFPTSKVGFTKYKVSMSFDSVRCDEPRNLNGNEVCTISFGGSATLVSESVLLGNQITKLGIKKVKIVSSTNIDINGNYVWLEPLEINSGLGSGITNNLLRSNNFKVNTHTDSITPTIGYTFAIDMSNGLIWALYKYGRYGKVPTGVGLDTFANGISPNMIFGIREFYSSWGTYGYYDYEAKITGDIDIENQESDVMSLSVTFQLQGENN